MSGSVSDGNVLRRERPVGCMDVIGFIQWPAMIVTVLAAWLTASQVKSRRKHGFWCFLASNALWITWGLHESAYALVSLQVALAGMNIRGAVKNDIARSARAEN